MAAGKDVLPIGSDIRWTGTSLALFNQVFLPIYGFSFPPFDTSNNPAYIIRTVIPQTFVRFYTPGISNPLGAWATAASEVRGLTQDQVWDRLALPQKVAPSHVAMMMGPTRDINPGANNTGTWLIGGYAGAFTYTEGAFSRRLNGGAYQYYLLGPGKPAGMVETLTSAEYGVPAVVFESGNYTTGLILNQNGTSNNGRDLTGGVPVFSYLYSANRTNSSRNTQSIAAALDRQNAPAGSSLYSTLYQPLDILWIRGQDDVLAAALNRINPEGYGALTLSRIHGTTGWLDALESHWDNSGEPGRFNGHWRVWGSIDGRTNHLDGWRSSDGRAIAGADRKLSEHWQIGALAGTGISRTHWQEQGHAKATNFDLGLYARYESSEGLSLSLAGLGGIGWVESRRQFTLLNEPLVAGYTPFGALAFIPDYKTPSAEFHAFDEAAHFSIGYHARLDRIRLTPSLQIDGLFSHIPEFTESGAGALDLNYQGMGGKALRVQAGLMVSFPISSGTGHTFEPWLQAGAVRYEELGVSEFHARFSEGDPFVIGRTSIDRTSGKFAMGLHWHDGKWTASGQVESELGGIESYGGRITIQRQF
jgi:hypothetical protein